MCNHPIYEICTNCGERFCVRCNPGVVCIECETDAMKVLEAANGISDTNIEMEQKENVRLGITAEEAILGILKYRDATKKKVL